MDRYEYAVTIEDDGVDVEQVYQEELTRFREMTAKYQGFGPIYVEAHWIDDEGVESDIRYLFSRSLRGGGPGVGGTTPGEE